MDTILNWLFEFCRFPVYGRTSAYWDVKVDVGEISMVSPEFRDAFQPHQRPEGHGVTAERGSMENHNLKSNETEGTDMKKLLIIMLLSGVLFLFGWGVQRVEVVFGWGPLRVEAQDSASLFNACANGNLAEAKQLLDKGADVNAKTKHGFTALMYASSNGHPEIVRLLLDTGADVNAKDRYGRTALRHAVYIWKPTEIVRLLLDKGADINAKDEYGWTALIAASAFGFTETVGLLLDKGAHVNARTKDGHTALVYASSNMHADVVRLLKDHGAEE